MARVKCEHCGTKIGNKNQFFILPQLGLSIVYNIPGRAVMSSEADMSSIPEISMSNEAEKRFEPVLSYVPERRFQLQLKNDTDFVESYSNYTPYLNTPQTKNIKGLFVYFGVGNSKLYPAYRNNLQTLKRIVDLTRNMIADTSCIIRKIQIVGFASVEGNHTEEVRPFQYTLDDEHIVGYGVLPKNPDPDLKPHPALSADTATQQQAGTAENPESTSAPAENNAAETPATETNVPTVTEGTSDYGSFVADSPVPEGTVLHVESTEPSVAVSNLIRNYVAKPMEAEPNEITVLTYTIWLATPQGGIADTGANVTVKTMLPLPVLDNSTGTPVLAQVKDCAVVYSSQDGTLHFYNAEVKIENGAVTGISFRAPEAAVYAICFVLK